MSTKLHIASAVNSNSSYCQNIDFIPLTEWTRIEVSHLLQTNEEYQFTIRIGDTIYSQIENTDPRELTDVKVYTSNNYHLPT